MHLCNVPVLAYPASVEAELEAAGRWEADVRSALRLVAWSSADCGALTAAVTGKGHQDLFNDIQLASRIIRRERSQVFNAGVVDFPSPLKQAVLLVFLNTIQVLERLASSLLFAPWFLMTELQMALFSATR